MRLSNGLAVVALAFCINAASPMWAKDGNAERQAQVLYAQLELNQIADAKAPIGRMISVPGRPVLKVSSGTCEEKIKRWKLWFRLCLKECDDIAAGYAKGSNANISNSSVYQKELNECLAACNSKNDYYKNSIC